ncbi:MAG: (2Fe-2S)-binding protein [Alphaproteobacteria bacterium]|nr:(2Fe-2S)-binding protein [Alphaproteobacteria bacterium]
MFRRLETTGGDHVEFEFDGRRIVARRGDSVAAALLAAGIKSFRTTQKSGAARGPFCMMGACFDCLVEIDGETVQACAVPVSQDLLVGRCKQVSLSPRDEQ